MERVDERNLMEESGLHPEYHNMNSQSPKTEPDPDAIKMFVGQVPRSMDENDLRLMFEEFGSIYQLNVLRDKITGQSKGCCFITFYTRKAALDAQNALHNIKTMPGMQHPIQMKPADSEKRNEERKLFIGMLAKKCSEIDIRTMFAPFGTIEECTVLRDQNGQSKGCAFITYSSKQCAQNAIKSIHHSQTMEGCRSPLVVKFADTQKEKELKKLQHQLNQNAGLLGMANLSNTGGIGGLGPQYLALLQQAAASGGAAGGGAGINNLGNQGVNTLQMQQILAAAASAASALQNNPGLATALASLNSTLTGLSNIGAAQGAQNQSAPTTPTGSVSMRGSPPTAPSPGDINSLQSLQNLQGLAALASMANNPAAGALGANTQSLAALQQLAAVNSMNSSSGASAMPSFNNSGTMSMAGSSNSTTNHSMSLQNSLGSLSGLGSHTQSLGSNGMNGLGSGSATGSNVGSNQASVDATLSQAYSGIQQYAGLSGLLGQASFPNAFTAQTAAQLQQAAATSPAGKQTEGPDGANLFIYHLPQEFGDHDLMQMFMPFGNVVSAKVFIDKQTNLSKCFGFVSYDNPVSAGAAIQAMNGFQIGMKRLKVQLKRPKSESKPY